MVGAGQTCGKAGSSGLGGSRNRDPGAGHDNRSWPVHARTSMALGSFVPIAGTWSWTGPVAGAVRMSACTAACTLPAEAGRVAASHGCDPSGTPERIYEWRRPDSGRIATQRRTTGGSNGCSNNLHIPDGDIDSRRGPQRPSQQSASRRQGRARADTRDGAVGCWLVRNASLHGPGDSRSTRTSGAGESASGQRAGANGPRPGRAHGAHALPGRSALPGLQRDEAGSTCSPDGAGHAIGASRGLRDRASRGS